MQEKDLRRWHRNVAIVFVVFIIIQAITGLLITLGEIGTPHTHAHEESQVQVKSADIPEPEQEGQIREVLAAIHHGGSFIGGLYRIILSIGMLWVAGSGALIYMRIQARKRPKKVPRR